MTKGENLAIFTLGSARNASAFRISSARSGEAMAVESQERIKCNERVPTRSAACDWRDLTDRESFLSVFRPDGTISPAHPALTST